MTSIAQMVLAPPTTLKLKLSTLPCMAVVVHGYSDDDQLTSGTKTFHRNSSGWRSFDDNPELPMDERPLIAAESLLALPGAKRLEMEFEYKGHTGLYNVLVEREGDADDVSDESTDYIKLPNVTVMDYPEATVELVKFGLSDMPDDKIIFNISFSF